MANTNPTCPTIPEQGFLRLPQILALIPVGASSWWRWCAEGKAPKPIKLGAKTTVWDAKQVSEFMEKLRQEGVQK